MTATNGDLLVDKVLLLDEILLRDTKMLLAAGLDIWVIVEIRSIGCSRERNSMGFAGERRTMYRLHNGRCLCGTRYRQYCDSRRHDRAC